MVRATLKLGPLRLRLLRPRELRIAERPEIDLDAALWTVPSVRMKRELSDLHQLTGHATMVFRGERHHLRPMSENTINAALRAMGFPADEVTGNGFRATARTTLHELSGLQSGRD